MKLFTFGSKDIGIDLGTANLLVTLKGKGIVLKEPSVVAINRKTGNIVATGTEAKEMLGRTPEQIRAVRPMKDGVIADFTATQLMLKNIIAKVGKRYNIGKPRVVVGVPSGITEVEERAVEEAVIQAGAREVYLIEEPMAAAIGASLDVGEPSGSIIVDIGGGTTEVAVISLGGIVVSHSLRIAGDELDEDIVNYIKRELNLAIGDTTAEQIKIGLGCAMPLMTEISMEIRGRDLSTGLPKNVTITSAQVEEAMKESIAKIVEIIEDDENFCLIPKGDSLEFIPLCIDNNKVTHYTKVNDQLKEQIPDEYLNASKELDEEYEGINIYNKDYTYLLWNYNGFYYINEEYTEELTLFDQELYNANLITYTEDYLIVADYDEEYTFNKFYRIAFKDGKIKEFNLNRDIYFDSYFPGYVKNKLYIVDNKEKEMYEFNAKNGDLEKIKPKMLNNDEWENVGIKSLISQNKKFSKKTNYEYNLDGDILYLNYQGKENNTVIDDEVTSIVRIKDNLIFYLKTDTLYAFDPLKGSTKLLKYFEWNFNYENMIYIN